MNYADRLEAATSEKRTPSLVGLDPHLEKLPEEFRAARDPEASVEERADDVVRFLKAVIEIVAPLVPAVKPQSAFFEELGAAGARAWEQIIREARSAGLLIIGDVKRGDIGSTSAAYARAFFQGADRESRCDAITVNPYLGSEGVEPFVKLCAETGAGLYVLVRTSNPGSARVQLHGNPPLYQAVAHDVREWGADDAHPTLMGECGLSSIGAVVGATHPQEMAHLREMMPTTPFLLPGYGAQGAGAGDIVPGFLAGGRGALVNSSRGILYANQRPEYAQLDWRDATLAATRDMVADLDNALKS